MEWIRFEIGKPLPPERRYVLVQIAPRDHRPAAVAVGYLRVHSGGPFFVIPGVGGEATHWCDCLGDDFCAPLWSGSGREFNLRVQDKEPAQWACPVHFEPVQEG